MINRYQWPKTPKKLSPFEESVRKDFVKYWHEVLPKKYTLIEQFNHHFPATSNALTKRIKTLEIGAGLGEHLRYEDLSNQDYYCLELRKSMGNEIVKKHPHVKVLIGDCQNRLMIEDHFFDRILAIHILEHLPRLPDAISEMHRLLKPDGIFSIVIPCDPGFAYSIARKLSAERIFKKKYKISYKPFIENEHVNAPDEILFCLKEKFTVFKRTFWPLHIPIQNISLCIGLHLKKHRTR